MNPVLYVYLLMALVLFLGFLFGIPYWRVARSGATIEPLEVVFMVIRKTAKPVVFNALALAQKHGLEVTAMQLETHLLAGGDPLKVVSALAKYKDRPGVTYQSLVALDLQSEDLEKSIARGGERMELQLFRVKAGTYEADVRLELESIALSEGIRHPKAQIEAALKQRIQQAEMLLQGYEYLEAVKLMETHVSNTDYWQEYGLIPIGQQVRLRKVG